MEALMRYRVWIWVVAILWIVGGGLLIASGVTLPSLLQAMIGAVLAALGIALAIAAGVAGAKKRTPPR